MRLKTFIWGFILLLAIAFIAYEIVNKTFVEPVKVIKTQVEERMDEALKVLEQ